MLRRVLWFAVGVAAVTSACDGSNGPTAPSGVAPPVDSPVPDAGRIRALYAQYAGDVQVSVGADMVTLTTTNVPDHPSPYFGDGHPRYEPPHAGMVLNPNRIVEQAITLRVPAAPAVSTASDTPLGPMGMAVNGVVFFNQYAAGRQPLTFEIETFDRYNGHPGPHGDYHYHLEPLWLTAAGRSRFLGVLLDGFPVYGPVDSSGGAPMDLDECHGHVGPTPDFPDGIYHYHVADAAPYIAGCFRGAPGTAR